MATYDTNGALSLEEQRRSIRAEELRGPSKLVSLAKGNQKPFNRATFEDVPFDEEVPDLILIEVSDDQLGVERARQEAMSKSMLFFAIIYVEGVEKSVAAFR